MKLNRHVSLVHINVLDKEKIMYIKRFIGFAGLVIIIVTSMAVFFTNSASASDASSLQGQVSAAIFGRYAKLSNNIVTEANPITYSVDFQTPFASITEVDYYFIFGNDQLDQWEWLQFTGDFPGGFGFLNPNPTPQTSRLLTNSCSVHPEVCNAFLDGHSDGEITISLFTGTGNPSINIMYLIVYVYGTNQIDVNIDIKPGSDTNPINPKSKGKIPVAILSTPDFDAPSMIDVSSLTFGKHGSEESLVFCNEEGEDVNGDGLLDLVCHFDNQLTLLNNPKSSFGYLEGNTMDGTPLEGSDTITILN